MCIGTRLSITLLGHTRPEDLPNGKLKSGSVFNSSRLLFDLRALAKTAENAERESPCRENAKELSFPKFEDNS